jgi:hypothetical protein
LKDGLLSLDLNKFPLLTEFKGCNNIYDIYSSCHKIICFKATEGVHFLYCAVLCLQCCVVSFALQVDKFVATESNVPVAVQNHEAYKIHKHMLYLSKTESLIETFSKE